MYEGAALEQVFPSGTLLRVAVHGGRVVGVIEGPVSSRHVELEHVVGTGSRVGAELGFAGRKSLVSAETS